VSEREMLRELRNISKILLLANSRMVESELSKVVSTVERKKMWVLIDGETSSKSIADKLGVSQRGVQYFLRDAKATGFVDLSGEFPEKTFDYVPPAWLEITALTESSGQERESAATPKITLDSLGAEKELVK